MAQSQFSYDNELGKYGEAVIKDMILNVYGIELFKGKEKWENIDVDFIDNKDEAKDVKDINNIYSGLKIEVKADRSKHTNIATELVSNTTKKTDGWLFVTKSDYLFIVRPALNRIYQFETNKLRNYVVNNRFDDTKVKIRYTSTHDTIEKKQLFYKTKLGILPIDKLQEAGIIDVIYSLDTYKVIYASDDN